MSDMKKYEFTGEVKNWFGNTLHRIRAVVSFGDVSVGDLGGWIEKEENLSHDGNAWVCNNAWVCDNARVCDNALVCDEARVYGNARVCDEAWVYGNARVCDEAWVCDNARVCDEAHWLGIACIGSRSDFTTFFRTKDLKIFVSCGCFRGDIDSFVEKVKKTHGDNRHARAYLAAVELAKIKIDLSE